MANFYKNFAEANLMSFGKSFARLNGQPLDKSAIWYSKTDADAYAAGGSAYVGQPVAVIDETNKTTTLYVVGANSTLEMVGSLPDGMSLEMHEGKIQLKGFAGAESGAQIRKNVDGELEWFVPSTDTVDGLQSAVAGLQSDMKTAQEDITALEGLVGEKAVGTQIEEAITALDLGETYEQKGAAATAKSEIEGVIGEVAEGKTVVEMIADAQSAATYDDTEVRAEIKAIKDDYLTSADLESVQSQLNTIMNNPDTEGVINSIEEFTAYINEHGEIADGFRTDIDANAKAISDHETLAAQTYETKNDASSKLTEAKEYADGLVAPMNEKLGGIEAGAQVNKVETVSAEFELVERELSIKAVEMSKVTGLEDALNGKAGAATTLAGYGITDAYTKTETEERIQEVLDGLSDTSETAASVAQALEAYKTSNDQRVLEVETKLNGVEDGAQVNKIDGVSGEFTISADGKVLNINLIEMDKVNGLTAALGDKVSAEDGKGLSTNDLTDELVEKINAAQANVLEGVQVNGVDVDIVDKKVNIKSTDIVKATEEVTVAEDGTLGLGKVNVNKLVQDDGSWLVLNGGTAAD